MGHDAELRAARGEIVRRTAAYAPAGTDPIGAIDPAGL